MKKQFTGEVQQIDLKFAVRNDVYFYSQIGRNKELFLCWLVKFRNRLNFKMATLDLDFAQT